MDREKINRKEAKKSLKIAGVCFLLVFLSSFLPHARESTMFFSFLGFIVFLIRSIVLFTGQNFMPLINELRQEYEEKNRRKCINCGFTGAMKNYLSTNKAQAILLILLCFLFLPGIIFWLIVRGKKICPKCQSLNNALI